MRNKPQGDSLSTSQKARFGSISLDIKDTKQYNNPDNESCNFHYLLLLGHKLLATKGPSLVAKTPQNYIKKSKIFICKCLFLAFISVNLSYANPIDTMNDKINELNNLNAEQNTKLNQSINARANTLTQKSKSLFLLKQNNELLMLEHKIQSLQDTKD